MGEITVGKRSNAFVQKKYSYFASDVSRLFARLRRLQ